MTRSEITALLVAIAGTIENRNAIDTIFDAIDMLDDDAARIHQLNEELLNVRADRDMLTARLVDRS